MPSNKWQVVYAPIKFGTLTISYQMYQITYKSAMYVPGTMKSNIPILFHNVLILFRNSYLNVSLPRFVQK
jgi:hypothetical protein